MISEIGTQIDLLENRVVGSLQQQSTQQQQQIGDAVAIQDNKIADIGNKLYALGSGVADLEQASATQLEEVRSDCA